MRRLIKILISMCLGCSQALAQQGHSVTLSCTPPSPPPASYSVYRSADDGTTFPLLAAGVPACAYSDTGVAGGKSYQYYMTAVYADGSESAPSNTVIAAIPLAPPSGAKATATKMAKRAPATGL